MANRLATITLASHYGFCMGVKRAIRMAEDTGRKERPPVNVINEIVHNDAVVSKLAADGVGSVPSVTAAPGGTIIVSAHGAPPELFRRAEKLGLKVVDATCPLVIRIHKIIHRLTEDGYQVIHFGDHDHDETRAVVGQAPEGGVVVVRTPAQLKSLKTGGKKCALTSQTTADLEDFERISDEARRLFPGILIHNTICNATTQRQRAVLNLAPRVELMLVVGSASSANSNRLRNISEQKCGRAYLINGADDIEDAWLEDITAVGVTAGASTPDFLVEEVIERLVAYSGGKARVIRPKAGGETRILMDE